MIIATVHILETREYVVIHHTASKHLLVTYFMTFEYKNLFPFDVFFLRSTQLLPNCLSNAILFFQILALNYLLYSLFVRSKRVQKAANIYKI
jgi:hypothetical protein